MLFASLIEKIDETHDFGSHGKARRGGTDPSLARRDHDGAGNGGRTRDLKLGKLALYQLSYARDIPVMQKGNRS